MTGLLPVQNLGTYQERHPSGPGTSNLRQPVPGGGGPLGGFQPGPDLQRFAGIFGSSTPQRQIEQMRAGEQPQRPPNPGGFGPQLSSVANSTVPGLATGNESNGQFDPLGAAAAAGGGGQQPGQQLQAQAGQAQQLPPVAPGQQFTPDGLQQMIADMRLFAPPATEQAVQQPTAQPMSQPPATTDQAIPIPDGFGAPIAQGQQMPFKAASTQVGANTTTGPDDRAAAEAPATPDTLDTLQSPGQSNSVGFVAGQGNVFEWDDPKVDWDKVRNSVKGTGETELLSSFIQNGTGWEKGFWAKGLGAKDPSKFNPLPPSDGVDLGLNFNGTTFPDEVGIAGSPNFISNKGVRDLLEHTFELSARIQQGNASTTGGELNDRDDSIAKWTKDLNLSIAALGRYGVNYDAGVGGGVDPGAGDPGTTPTPGGDPGTGTGGGTGGGDSPFQGPFSDLLQTNDPTDVFTGQLSFSNPGLIPPEILRMFGNADTPEGQAAAATMARELANDRLGRINQDNAVTLQGQSIDQFQDNPMFGQIQDTAQSLVNRGDIPFDLIRNQAASDNSAAFQTQQDSLSRLLRGTGNTAAAGGGIAAEMGLNNASNLTRLLSDLRVEEAITNRQVDQQNLGALTGAFASTAGPLAQLQQQQAELVRGGAITPANPLAGAFGFASDLTALKLAAEAREAAGEGDKGAIGSLAGGVLGAGVGALAGNPLAGFQIGQGIGGSIGSNIKG